jgi:ADP-ribose pyrophosphatase
MTEKTLHSNIIYEGKLINLRKDKNIIGNRVFFREVVEHPGAVAIVPLLNKDTILMVKQYRNPAKSCLFEIPAGTLEKNESPEQCAYRELTEETGYKVEKLKKILSCYLAPGYSNELIHIFLASDIKKANQELEADEDIEVFALNLNEIKNKIKRGEIKDAKTIAGISYLLLFGSK